MFIPSWLRNRNPGAGRTRARLRLEPVESRRLLATSATAPARGSTTTEGGKANAVRDVSYCFGGGGEDLSRFLEELRRWLEGWRPRWEEGPAKPAPEPPATGEPGPAPEAPSSVSATVPVEKQPLDAGLSTRKSRHQAVPRRGQVGDLSRVGKHEPNPE